MNASHPRVEKSSHGTAMPSSSRSSGHIFDHESAANGSFALAEARRLKFNSFRVFRPRFVLALFVLMNFLTYYDRGCMATAIASIRTDHSIAGDHPISQTQAGLLVSIFMVGFLIASPLFAGLGGVLSAKTIIIIGLATWSVAVVVTGVMRGFYGLLITRAFVGVGEAAYVGYTVTMVDNMAPPHLRTLWIGIFYSMIPVGTAMGMAMGGILSQEANVGNLSGWRMCFLTEVGPMLVVVGAMCFLPAAYNPLKDTTKPAPHLDDNEEQRVAAAGIAAHADDAAAASNAAVQQIAGDEFVPLPTAVKLLMCNLDYVLLVFAYGMYTFVLGAVSVWAVSMMTQGPLKQTTIHASIFLGGTTAFTGLVGSLLGGVVVDKLGGSIGLQGVYKCSVVNAVLIAISVPCGMVSLAATSFALFAIFLIIAVFALMSITAPVNSSILTVVPKSLRTYAITLSITLMHSIGDVPSPIIAGAISDAFDDGCSAINNPDAVRRRPQRRRAQVRLAAQGGALGRLLHERAAAAQLSHDSVRLHRARGARVRDRGRPQPPQVRHGGRPS